MSRSLKLSLVLPCTSKIFDLKIFVSAISYAVSNITYALEKTSESKSDALLGLMPIVLFYGEIAILFGSTQWAWDYPALAMLIVFPSYCLMTCRHIICSVTKMKFNWRQKNPFWFLLFIANKYALTFLRKSVSSLTLI